MWSKLCVRWTGVRTEDCSCAFYKQREKSFIMNRVANLPEAPGISAGQRGSVPARCPSERLETWDWGWGGGGQEAGAEAGILHRREEESGTKNILEKLKWGIKGRRWWAVCMRGSEEEEKKREEMKRCTKPDGGRQLIPLRHTDLKQTV